MKLLLLILSLLCSVGLQGCTSFVNHVNKFVAPKIEPHKTFMVCPNLPASYTRRVVEDEMIRRMKNYGASGTPCEISSKTVNYVDLANKIDAILVVYLEDQHVEQMYLPPTTFSSPGFTWGTATAYTSPNLGFGSTTSGNSQSFTTPGVTTQTGGYSVNYVDLYYGAAIYSSLDGKRTWKTELQQEFTGKTIRQIAADCSWSIAREMSNDKQFLKQ